MGVGLRHQALAAKHARSVSERGGGSVAGAAAHMIIHPGISYEYRGRKPNLE